MTSERKPKHYMGAYEPCGGVRAQNTGKRKAASENGTLPVSGEVTSGLLLSFSFLHGTGDGGCHIGTLQCV